MLPSQVCDSPPKSTPEDIGALNLLSLHNSTANEPPAGLPAGGGEESLFIPEDLPAESRPIEPVASTHLEKTLSQVASLSVAPLQAGDGEAEAGTADPVCV